MGVYATDEDIALRASTDFSALCPRDQLLASGVDGAFAPSDPWTLRSASVDFAAFGLTPGLLARLTKPTTAFGPNGELFAIQAVAPGSITLRRKGQPAGVGQPPAPPGGLAGVEFSVRTLGPQITLASYDLDRRFGIDDVVAGRRSVDLADPHQLREAVVLTVLFKQYLDQSRQFAGRIADPSETPGDVYAAKARIAKAELDELLDRIALRWNERDVARSTSATTRFSTRLSR
jgi:hypothetical protein